MIVQIVKAMQTKAAFAAIDRTGFSLNNRSNYLCTIAGKRKLFMQFNACGELKYNLITAVKLRKKRRNENIDVAALLRKSKQLKITRFLADKVYDSEKNHKLLKNTKQDLLPKLKITQNTILN